MGLSPRVRGNRHPATATCRCPGSIPARAGEPSPCGHSPTMRTFPHHAFPASSLGLSPRVRGNRRRSPGRSRLQRSIPARAGEPSTGSVTTGPTRVYPRACGGTPVCRPRTAIFRGLSPRVRGNRLVIGQHHDDAGSIPARAGEPRRPPTGARSAEVYPRACGGTASR